jgi:CBS domain-containing protein
MPVASYARRSVCLALPEETLQVAAQRMEKEGVGLLVVVRGGRPAGVLTDRDVALQLLAEGGDRVADAMNRHPWTVRSDAPLRDAVALMARRGVRRLPVVDAAGHSIGVVAADDLLRLLAREIDGLAEVAAAQLPSGPQPGFAPGGAGPSPQRSAEPHLREVVSVRTDADVRAALAQMRSHATGSVVVVDEAGTPQGILTDRDVALRVVARGLDAGATPVSAVMSAPLVACEASRPLDEVVATMRAHGVRRVPIVRGGRLVGLVSYDDLLTTFGEELRMLSRAATRQVHREQRRAQLEQTRKDVGRGLQQTALKLGSLGHEGVRALRRGVGELRSRLHR